MGNTIIRLCSQFGRQRKRSRQCYIDFVRAGVELSLIWEKIQKQVFLGEEAFVEKHQQKIFVGRVHDEANRRIP